MRGEHGRRWVERGRNPLAEVRVMRERIDEQGPAARSRCRAAELGARIRGEDGLGEAVARIGGVVET